MIAENIPAELRERNQWVVWKLVERDGQRTKLPFQPNGLPAKSNDPSTWGAFWSMAEATGFDGPGFVFSADDDLCGIDFDGCRNPETGEVDQWAKRWILALDSYSEVSPSGTGIKVFCRAKSPFTSGKKTAVREIPICDKEPAVELYDRLRYFAVTGLRLAGVSRNIESRQQQVNELAAHFWPQPKAAAPQPFESDAAVIERARKYLAKLPPAISGSGGHNATFYAACVLVLGFELSEADALNLMREYNQACQPPWSERELEHKVRSAAQQQGERGYLRNAKPEQWSRIRVPKYEAPRPQPELRITTLEQASFDHLERVKRDEAKLIDLGLPDVDCAIGGGVEFGEMVILAARPSHGKSAVALQCVHHATSQGLPSLMISEEMSALALGKRAIQFASDVPKEHWRYDSALVERQLRSHFAERAPCHVIESVGSAERAAEEIERAARERGVRFVAVDYAQLLRSSGKSRYEQITNTSVVLRQVASSTQVVLIVLCQLSRAVELRSGPFEPQLSDIKDSGQLEQDADVVLMLCWPHRLDRDRHPYEYLFYVRKNRNREINATVVKCQFKPSRQMFLDDPKSHRSEFDGRQSAYEPLEQWNPDAEPAE